MVRSLDMVSILATLLFVCTLSCTSAALPLQSLNIKSDHKRPWFCHGLDCPKYKVLDSSDAYETRRYESGVWASTNVETYNYFVAVNIGFARLFKYIDGDNKDQVKIPMTSPVLVDTEPSCGPFCKQNFTVSFFVPFHLQEHPPKPDNPDVYINTLDEFIVYVAQSGGFKMDEFSLSRMAVALADALDSDGLEYEGDHWYVAGYDPPFRLTNRHTEIWIKKKEKSQDDDGRTTLA